jgi:hypothetical protein
LVGVASEQAASPGGGALEEAHIGGGGTNVGGGQHKSRNGIREGGIGVCADGRLSW